MNQIRTICFFLFLSKAFSIHVLWVNNIQAEGDGSRASPFRTLKSAFNAASQSNDSNVEIILVATRLPYFDTNISFASMSRLSLVITSENPDPLTERCQENYAVYFEGDFPIANFSSFEFRGITSVFNRTMRPKFSIQNLESFKITNCCFSISQLYDRSIYKFPAVFYINNINNINTNYSALAIGIRNVTISQYGDFTATSFMRLEKNYQVGSIIFNNLELFDDRSYVLDAGWLIYLEGQIWRIWLTNISINWRGGPRAGGVFAFGNGSQFYAENITMKAEQSHSLKTIWDVSNMQTIELFRINIQIPKISDIQEQLIILKDNRYVHISDISIILQVRGGNISDVFYIQSAKTLSLKNVTVGNSNVHRMSLFTINEKESEVMLDVNSISIKNSSFSTGSLISTKFPPSYFGSPLFALSNIKFSDSNFTEIKAFELFSENVYGSGNITTSNLSISRCQFISSKILTAQHARYFKIENVTCKDSNFSSKNLKEAYVFGIQADEDIQILNINFTNSRFAGYFIFAIDPTYTICLFLRGLIQDTNFKDSSIMTTIKSSLAYSSEARASIFYLQGVNFTRLELSNFNNPLGALDFRGTYFFITECNFENLTLNVGSFALFKDFDAITEYKKINDLLGSQWKSHQILFQRIKNFQSDSPEKKIQYRFENNSVVGVTTIERTYFTSSFIKIEYSGFPSGTIINENTFMRIKTRANFIFILGAFDTEVLRNLFSEIVGSGSFWYFEEFLEKNATLSVQKNTIEDFQQVQFLKISARNVEQFDLSSNLVSSSSFDLLPIVDLFLVGAQINRIYIKDNSFLEIVVGNKGLLDLNATNGKELHFINNTLKIQVSSKQKNAKEELVSIFQDRPLSLMFFQMATGKLVLKECDMSIEYETSGMSHYLGLLFAAISIDKLTIYSSKDLPPPLLNIFTKNATIKDSTFLFQEMHDESLDLKQMTIIKAVGSTELGDLALFMRAVRFISVNPNLKRNLVDFSEVNRTEFVFESSEVINTSLVFDFKDIIFSQFSLRNLNFSHQMSANVAQWTQFTRCSGKMTFERIAFLLSSSTNSINLIKVNNSPNLSLLLSNLTIDSPKDWNAKINSSNFKSLQIINADSGNLILESFRLEQAFLYDSMFLITASQGPVTLTLKQLKLLGISHSLSEESKISVGILHAESPQNYKLDIIITKSEFTDINASNNVIYSRLPPNSIINITKSQFLKIETFVGSVLTVQPQRDKNDQLASTRFVSIEDSNFSNNKATNFVGTISLRGVEFVLANTTVFDNNSAPLGSSIFLDDVQSNVLTNRSTILLKEIGLPPALLRLKRSNQSGSSEYVVTSNYSNSTPFEIHNITSDELSFMEVRPEDSFDRTFPNFTLQVINLRTSEDMKSNWGNTSCLTPNLTGMVGGYKGSNETLALVLQIMGVNVQTFYVKVYFRNCVTGETPLIVNGNQGCKPCPFGEYSLYSNLSSCEKCPYGTHCLGGSRLELLPGFWRKNTSTAQIEDCRKNGSTNGYIRCEGGYSSSCTKGYQGPLCHQCDFQDEYAISGTETNFRCLKCPQQRIWEYLIAISLFFLFVAYEIYFIYTAIKTGRLYYEAALTDENHVVPTFGPYVNLITTYFQILSIISMFEIEFINSILRLSSIIGEPASQINYSLDCILLNWKVNPENLMIIRLVLVVLSPFLKWTVVMLYYLAIKGLNKSRRMVLGVAGLSLFLLEQPQMLKGLMQYLDCVKLDPKDESLFIAGFENFTCDSDQYKSFKYWFVIPAAVCLSGFPLVLLLILFKKRQQNKLNSEWNRCILGVLYNGLKKEAYYWGIVGNISKTILIILTVIINDLNLLTPLLIVWLYSYKLLLSWKKPYISHKLLMAENYMINAYLTALFCAYCMVQGKVDLFSKILFLILIVVTNFYAIGFVVFRLISMSKSKALGLINWIKQSRLWRILGRLFLGEGKKQKKVDNPNSVTSSDFQNGEESDSFYRIIEDQALGGDQKDEEHHQQKLEDRL